MSRIIFINRYFHPDTSATSQLLSDLAAALAAGPAAPAVEVWTSRQLYETPGARLPRAETWRGVRVRRLWSTRFGRATIPGRLLDYLSFFLAVGLALTRLSGGASVVFKTDPPLLHLWALLPGARRRWRAVAWCQDIFPEIAWPDPARRGSLFRLLAALRRRALRRCAAVVAIGPDMAARLRAILGGRPPVLTIENWFPGAPPAAATPPAPCPGRLRLYYCGNLGRVHSYATMLAALRLLGPGSGIEPVFVGGGARYPALQAELSAAEQRWIRFLPYVPAERLADTLAAADAHWLCLRPSCRDLVVPSKYYGILAAGRPCLFIGDPESALAREIAAAGIGCVHPPDDAAGLAASLARLRDDPAARLAMGARARALHAQRATRQHAIAAWRQLANELAGTTGAS